MSTYCPTCSGLECLCRPRFFAGQLLTEEDLRALDHYIIEKNKLHNRNLHGSGVVCGLEVLCHECKGWVTIKQGHALDPCGNDIVVCEDQPFNLCAAIDACCAKRKIYWDCEPAAMLPECDELPTSWYVTLRYVERPSRGITALQNSPAQPYCSKCGCESVSAETGCHFGCHGTNGHSHRSARTATTVRRPPAQCEPTRVCEGFVIEVAPAPAEPQSEEDPSVMFSGTFLGRWHKCLAAIDQIKERRPTNLSARPEQAQQMCCAYKRLVWDFLRSHSSARCSLLKDLESIRCPEPLPPIPGASQGFPNVSNIVNALDSMDSILDQLRADCRCLALLPACPGPIRDPRVILACVTVQRQGSDCRIVDICHWRGRRTLWTWPNAFHWLSVGAIFRQVLERACCQSTPVPASQPAPVLTDVPGAPSVSSPSNSGTPAAMPPLSFQLTSKELETLMTQLNASTRPETDPFALVRLLRQLF